MTDESPKSSWGHMNRRRMLGTTTALVGGAIAGMATDVLAQDKPPATPATAAATAPISPRPSSRSPAARSAACTKARRCRFSGSPTPRPTVSSCRNRFNPGLASKSAQVWGAICPSPRADDRERGRARVSASLLHRERALPVSERLEPESHAGGEEAGHGLDARRRVHQRRFDGVLRLRRTHPQ